LPVAAPPSALVTDLNGNPVAGCPSPRGRAAGHHTPRDAHLDDAAGIATSRGRSGTWRSQRRYVTGLTGVGDVHCHRRGGGVATQLVIRRNPRARRRQRRVRSTAGDPTGRCIGNTVPAAPS
jgi:hypothetical protein